MSPGRLWLIAGFLASASLAFGQLDTNSITIASSRSISLQPDQVVFGVDVHSNLNTGLDEVISGLQGSGITAANLTGVYGGGEAFLGITASAPGLDWAFSIGAALERVQNTIASLTALQQKLARKPNGSSLTFSVQNTQVSARLQQPDQCQTADLVGDALAQARRLADAAGVSAGPIIAISDGSTDAVGFAYFGFFGGPGFRQLSASSAPYLEPQPFLYCTITVKFQLLRYQ
jgi:hypothetical protein